MSCKLFKPKALVQKTAWFCFLSSLLLFFFPLLEAASITYWKPSVKSKDRTTTIAQGEIARWSWQGGIEYKDWESGNTLTIERANIIDVQRQENDRSPELNEALFNSDQNSLLEISQKAKSLIDREEALYQLAVLKTATSPDKPSLGIQSYNAYITSYPKGNFLDKAYSALAKLQLQTGQKTESLKTLEKLATLGSLQEAQATITIGEIYLSDNKLEESLAAFEKSAAEAKKVLASFEQTKALGWGGELALRLGKKELAKNYFEQTLEISQSGSFDYYAKGLACKGLAVLGGSNEESYTFYLKAAYWLEGDSREAECIIGALRIADKKSSPQAKKWTQRAEKLREVAQRYFATELKAYDEEK